MKRLALAVVVLALSLSVRGARADEGAPAPAAEGQAVHEGGAAAVHEAAASEGEHGAKEGHKAAGGHWSLLDVFVPGSLRSDVAGELGDTWIGGTPVETVDHVIFAAVVFLVLVVLLGFARGAMKKDEVLPQARFNPLGLFEFLTDALLSLMEGILGRERALKFLPLVGSLGLFILFSNFLGIIPGFLPPTSNLNTTFALGSIVFFATHFYGVQAHGIGYFKHFFGPILKWYALPLMLLMFVIELISHIARPVSLGIRLFGNMFGDHATVAGFLAVGVFGWIILPIIPFPLGILVCVVQTLVFCILSTVYIHVATEEAEEGHEGGHH